MKKLLAVAVLFGFACPLMGSGDTNLYIVNKTKEKINVWVKGSKEVLHPGQGRSTWHSGTIYGPLQFTYKGKKYTFTGRDFFPIPSGSIRIMEIHDLNTRGSNYDKYQKYPGVSLEYPKPSRNQEGSWPARPL